MRDEPHHGPPADAILDAVPDVIWHADADWRLDYVSPSVTGVLGWEPAQLLGRRAAELVDQAEVGDDNDARLRAGKVVTLRGHLQRADGSWVWVENRVVAAFDGDGSVVGYSGVARNVEEQVAAELELAESRRRTQMLLEHGSDVVIEGDNDGVLRYVTDSIVNVLGWQPSEIVGRSVAFIVCPDDMPTIRHAQEEVLAGREVRFEARFRTRDDRPVWMSVLLRPLFDADGAVVGRAAGWRNIDTERRMRDELRASEEHFRFLVENASDVVVQEVEGVPTYVSESITAMLGWSPSDLVGASPSEFWHPEDRPSADDMRAQVHDGAAMRRTMRMRHRDGGHRWIEVSARSVQQPDGRRGAVGTLRDVTDREDARQALAEASERDRLIAELASDVFAMFGADGIVAWASGNTVALLGVAPDELVGMNGRDLFAAEDPAVALQHRAALEAGETVHGLVELVRPDGARRWVDRRSRAVFDDDGAVRYFATSWRDAQSEVEYRRALEVSERAANEANRAKTSFLSRMSHELRTPLNAVLGFAQLLALDELRPEQASSVEQIMLGGRHLLDLINEVLDISRIEAGRMSLSPEVVKGAEVIREAIELVRPLGAEHGITVVSFDDAGCGAHLLVDRQRTIQVLLNLLGNGIKYNRPGGRVWVVCREVSSGEVAIEVHDEGLGIAADDLPRLFEPFERLDAAARGVEGTGIGLALSKALAEMMGGRLDAASTLGVGSVFTLVLPAARPVEPRVTGDAVESTDAPLVVAPLRVLYLEDNPASVALMESVLARRPAVQLQVATSAAAALDAVSTSAPDLVLLDLHLPDMSGEDVLRRLRTSARTATVPVVVVSADATPDVRNRLIRLGADGFIPKPIDLTAVLEWVDRPARHRSG